MHEQGGISTAILLLVFHHKKAAGTTSKKLTLDRLSGIIYMLCSGDLRHKHTRLCKALHLLP